MTSRPRCETSHCEAWFAHHIPESWFIEPVRVRADRDEIVVTGKLAPPDVEDAETAHSVARSRIASFRDQTRTQRMSIAEAAQGKWQRVVSWEATCGPATVLFTSAAVPVMTRLRFDQRQVLDTLIDAGVARSRSEALVWCVRQVEDHQGEWIERLQSAMTEVERIRSEGP